ncbi:hypothetical protein PG993_008390 [Apiospora rasikravindrae]|uniref:Uncharacterized protein n=1 Tax=Apiospora rasikravindrae TaxID=990691 RepID=A0ABR1T233_9PEZI
MSETGYPTPNPPSSKTSKPPRKNSSSSGPSCGRWKWTTPPPPPVLPLVKTSPETTAAMAMTMAATQQRAQRKMLMAACREYAESRRHLLRERLRQCQFWTSSRAMGRRVPSAAPGDWALADAEWAKWLGDQAAAIQQQQNKTALSDIEGERRGRLGGRCRIYLRLLRFRRSKGRVKGYEGRS